MSGKEAQVFLVRCGQEICCAKVYKDVADRSFKKAVPYQEGRKIRNSRRQRAMEKRSKFGRDQQEVVWQRAEVDALFRLADFPPVTLQWVIDADETKNSSSES